MNKNAFLIAVVAVCVSACGGGGSGSAGLAQTSASAFSVGGSIAGLGSTSGLTLVNGTETLPIAANATDFTFVGKVAQGSNYSISIGKQPTGLVCKLSSASGSIAQADVHTVAVACSPVPFTVSTLIDSSKLANPYGVATDSAGNIYAVDFTRCSVLKSTPAGVVTNLAGGGTCNSVDGTGPAAQFNGPTAVAIDKTGNVFVAESQAIRKITQAGVVTTLFGSNGQALVDTAGAPVAAFTALGIAVDSAGMLYASTGGAIVKITPGGVLTVLAGTGMQGVSAVSSSAYGYVDGVGSAARFGHPAGIALDASGNVLVADQDNNAIRKISPQGQVTTFLAAGSMAGPVNVAVDAAGTVYATGDRLFIDHAGFISYFGGTVSVIGSAGIVTKIGTNANGGGYSDGPPATAQFFAVQGIAVDSAGIIYVADQGHIRKITP